MHCGLAAAIIAHGGGGAPHATLSDGGLHRTPASRPIGASSAVQAPCERLRMGSTLQEAEASALARKRPGPTCVRMMYALYFEKLPSNARNGRHSGVRPARSPSCDAQGSPMRCWFLWPGLAYGPCWIS